MIQAALDDPARKVITLGEGTFNFNSGNLYIRPGKTLEGLGSDHTQLRTAGLFLIGIDSGAQLSDLKLTGPGKLFTTDRMLVRPGVDTGETSYFSIKRCMIEEFTGAAINVWGHEGAFANQFAIEDNRLSNNGNAGVQVGPGCWSFTVENNIIEYNGANGIDINGSYGMIRGNVVRHNGWNGEMWYYDINGIYIFAAKDMNGMPRDVVGLEVYGNEIYENRKSGIHVGAALKIGRSSLGRKQTQRAASHLAWTEHRHVKVRFAQLRPLRAV